MTEVSIILDGVIHLTKYGTRLIDILSDIGIDKPVYNRHGKALPDMLPIRGAIRAWREPPFLPAPECTSQSGDDLSPPQ